MGKIPLQYREIRKLRTRYNIPKARMRHGFRGYSLHFSGNRVDYSNFFERVPENVETAVFEDQYSIDPLQNTEHFEIPTNDHGESEMCEDQQYNDDDDQEPAETEYDPMTEKLYAGCRINFHESADHILALLLRFNMPFAAIAAIIECVNAHLPTPVLNSSKYKFLKHVQSSMKNMEKFYFCNNPKCNNLLGKDLEAQVVCEKCEREFVIRNCTTYYASIGLKDQLVHFLESSPEICDEILQNWTNYKFDGQIKDFCDGSEYRKLRAQNSKPFITLSFCSDGFESPNTGLSLWPFMFCLNELPKLLRFRNLFLSGIWQGNSKVPAESIMEIVVVELNDLAINGVHFNYRGKKLTLPVFTICGCFDSPARAKFIGLTQYNGYFGCNFCYERGIRTAGTVMWPASSIPPTLRSPESYEIDKGFIGNRDKSLARGVLRISGFETLEKFCVVNNTTIDYMHGAILGVMGGFETLWFNKKTRTKEYSLFIHINELDSIITKFKPPSFVSRRPQKVSKCSEWKANEWRNFLLFYSVPLLQPFMKEKYFSHFMLFVNSMFTLTKNSFSSFELEKVQSDLFTFVRNYQNLYGLESMSSNVHLLLHLGNSAKKFGPLWAHSMFTFETYIMTLGKYVQGPRNAQTQILQKYLLSKSLIWSNKSIINKFIKNIDYSTNTVKKMKESYTKPLGKGTTITDSFSSTGSVNSLEFKRISHNGQLYTTPEYQDKFKFKNNFVQLQSGEFVMIQRITESNDKEYSCLCQLLITKPFEYLDQAVRHIHEIVAHTSTFYNVSLDEIERLCIHLNVQQNEYITYAANDFESD